MNRRNFKSVANRYTNNYKKNLELYWQQFYPNWKVATGFHVHHIKPVCTFEDRNDPRIHHPRNLIALHIDDHISIHRCRGDNKVSEILLSVKGRVMTDETKQKIGLANKGKKRTTEQKQILSALHTGKKLSKETKQKMSISHSGMKKPWVAETNKNRTHTEEAKQKISNSLKGRVFSEESKLKMSIAQKNRFAKENT